MGAIPRLPNKMSIEKSYLILIETSIQPLVVMGK